MGDGVWLVAGQGSQIPPLHMRQASARYMTACAHAVALLQCSQLYLTHYLCLLVMGCDPMLTFLGVPTAGAPTVFYY